MFLGLHTGSERNVKINWSYNVGIWMECLKFFYTFLGRKEEGVWGFTVRLVKDNQFFSKGTTMVRDMCQTQGSVPPCQGVRGY